MSAPLGEQAVPAKDGGTGFTVVQTARLLGCGESTARNKFGSASMRDSRNRVLCPADKVLEERGSILRTLGAVESGVDADKGVPELLKERDELKVRLATAEEKIRLIAAARSAAREKELNSMAEEKAYMEMALLDLDPLRH